MTEGHQDCIHLWEVWAWIAKQDVRGYSLMKAHLHIHAECRRCGTVWEGSAPLGSRVGAVLPGVGSLETAEEQP